MGLIPILVLSRTFYQVTLPTLPLPDLMTIRLADEVQAAILKQPGLAYPSADPLADYIIEIIQVKKSPGKVLTG